MINVVPTQPGCVMATQVRLEVEAEDLPRIKAELGLDRDVTPDDVTTWAIHILNRHITKPSVTLRDLVEVIRSHGH